LDVYEESIKLHKELRGKLGVKLKKEAETQKDLSLLYTPGVAEPCRRITKDPSLSFEYTGRGNTIAIVSDGSAVLGLGNLGALGAMPVMEGKALLFKEFGDVDAIPLCIDTQDADEIIGFVKKITPSFGGINLEDISAPRCFKIKEGLQDIGIPVFHDDQDGTAIVVRAALENAVKVSGKSFEDLKVVMSGAGAAGVAIAKLLQGIDLEDCPSVADVVVCDSKGVVDKTRNNLNESKKRLVDITNKKGVSGTLADALVDADVFVGVSVGGIVSKEMVESMADEAIVFPMANPTPEIGYHEALDAGASVVGTGRSDFPNQVNNVLGFPGLFRGALDARASKLNTEMFYAASCALRDYIEKPTKEMILPSPLDKGVGAAVGKAVEEAAGETGVSESI